jgi:NAD+ kinase
MGRSALLLVNPLKPAAATAAAEVRGLIEKHGRLIAELPADNTPLPAVAKDAELIVVFGGDGTLLSQARRAALPGTAMLGVNMGRLGFLAEFDMPALREQAASIFGSGELVIQEFGLIQVQIFGPKGDKPRFEEMALNEAVLTAGPPYRMITLAFSIDGHNGPTISGDGVIISSPLGSTAYNLSAGGPILSPFVDGFAITPIAAHSLSVRPVVVPGNSRIEIKALKANRESRDPTVGTTLVLDGQVQTPVSIGDRILITRHERRIRFVQNPKSDYWSRLIGKMNWATGPKFS